MQLTDAARSHLRAAAQASDYPELTESEIVKAHNLIVAHLKATFPTHNDADIAADYKYAARSHFN